MSQENKKKKNPPPGRLGYENMEPKQEPNTNPGTGVHEPDIQDERGKNKRVNKPIPRDGKFPEETPGDDPREYNDGEPVEERSPKLPDSF